MKALLQRSGWLVPACLAVLLPMGAAHAQMTNAQKDALRSNCRSDYMANCMSVTPGGIEALQCLQQNSAKLSSGCRAAVSSATPKPAAAAPPPAPPPSATAPLAPAAPTPATAAAPAAPPPVASPAPTATPAKKAKATAPEPRVPPPPKHAAAPTSSAPPPNGLPSPEIAKAKIDRMPLMKQLNIVRACGKDREAVCPTVAKGGGLIVACLVQHTAALSPFCKQTLAAALR